MLTTVTSFAIAGANFVKKEIEDYVQKFTEKMTEEDKKNQDLFFSTHLSDGLLSNFPKKIKDKDRLVKALENINKNLPKSIINKFKETYIKIRFFSFNFSIYSSVMILFAGLMQSQFLTISQLISYTILSLFYFIFIALSYDILPKNPIKRYFIGTLIIFLSFIFVILSSEDLLIILFIIGFIFGYLNHKYKEYSATEYLFVTVSYSLVAYFTIFYNTINFNKHLMNIFNNLPLMNHDSTLICLIIFIILYIMCTLFIPVLCFYVRGKYIIKKHKISREAVWNKFDSLKIFEQEITKTEHTYNELGKNLEDSIARLNNENITDEQINDIKMTLQEIIVDLENDKKLISRE